MFLDTQYFNAHGTATDALWAGLPLLTLPGDNYQSRAALSHLLNLGLPELVVSSFEEYEELAVGLAKDAQAGGRLLADLRQRLATARTTQPLFNTKLWLKDFEAGLELIWANHAAGREPQHTVVPSTGDAESIETFLQLRPVYFE